MAKLSCGMSFILSCPSALIIPVSPHIDRHYVSGAAGSPLCASKNRYAGCCWHIILFVPVRLPSPNDFDADEHIFRRPPRNYSPSSTCAPSSYRYVTLLLLAPGTNIIFSTARICPLPKPANPGMCLPSSLCYYVCLSRRWEVLDVTPNVKPIKKAYIGCIEAFV